MYSCIAAQDLCYASPQCRINLTQETYSLVFDVSVKDISQDFHHSTQRGLGFDFGNCMFMATLDAGCAHAGCARAGCVRT